MKKPLVIITGPTAVGKTDLSIGLAKKINGEIISADSMQVYKKMDIGTAKITPSEMQGIKHHLIDILDYDVDFNVFDFKARALEAMEEIYEKGKIPIVVGGTGFYIQALLYDVEFSENDGDMTYRNELKKICDEKGPEFLHDMLADIDPEAAKAIHFNNVKRVIRALEFFKQTGRKISEHNEEQQKNESPYNFAYFVLNDDRDLLYKRIDRRVDLMFEQGILEEVDNIMKLHPDENLTSMKAIGYREFFDYYKGNITIDDVKEQIKTDTRHFAKRQLTWFRREKEVIMVNKNEYYHDNSKILEYLINILKEKEII